MDRINGSTEVTKEEGLGIRETCLIRFNELIRYKEGTVRFFSQETIMKKKMFERDAKPDLKLRKLNVVNFKTDIFVAL